LIQNGEPMSVFFHGCCCKHLAMIAETRLMGNDVEDYCNVTHPTQEWVLQVIGEFAGLRAKHIPLAIDGCGVPVHAMSVKRMAYSFQRLACEGFEDEKYKAVCRKITNAMLQHPFLVSGTGCFDYKLVEALQGEVVAKTGAEGVICIGIPGSGVGIAINVRDGNPRALTSIAARVIQMLSLLPAEKSKCLDIFQSEPLYNIRGETIGEISAAF